MFHRALYRIRIASVAVVTSVLSCSRGSDSTAPAISPPPEGGGAPPTPTAKVGTLNVFVHATGTATDSSGFRVVLGTFEHFIPVGDTAAALSVPEGTYSAALGGVDTHCEYVSGAGPVTITSGQAQSLTFTIECLGSFVFTRLEAQGSPIYIRDSHGADRRISEDSGTYTAKFWYGASPRLFAMVYRGSTGLARSISTLGNDERPVFSNGGDASLRFETVSADGAATLVRQLEPVSGSCVYRIADSMGANLRTLFNCSAYDSFFTFAPDGRSIAFLTGRWGPFTDIAVARTDGSAPRRVASLDAIAIGEPSWSPDGGSLSLTWHPRSGGAKVSVVPATGGTLQSIWNVSGTAPSSPIWSPDSKLIALTVVPSGSNKWQLGLVQPDGTNPRIVPIDSMLSVGSAVNWSADGKMLLFTVMDPITLQQQIAVVRSDGTGYRSLPGSGSRRSPLWLPATSLRR